ncbi:MAG: esterase family protein [Clostridia bacterium]|nr:esterase family protein [Clostridia bacterium]
METQYVKTYSHALQRDMECKFYGHGGKPVLFIPCQDGRFFDFENFRMTDYWGPYIDAGLVTVLSIDTIDKETYSDNYTPAYDRIRRHEAWVSYIINEAIPMLRERTGRWDVITFGCSLGATHALNLFLRFPDTVRGTLALSGIFDSNYGFGNYMDELVYANSPVHYMNNMVADHPYIEKYNSGKGIVCVGTGAWEIPDSTLRLRDIFNSKGINIWVDVWGNDVAHDWDWWYKQVEYFIPKLLED